MGVLNPWKDRGEDGNPSDGRPKFGRKARGWFLEAVYAYLTVPVSSDAPAIVEDADTAWTIARRLQQRAPELVSWVPDVEYRGRRFSTGSWQLDKQAILDGTETIVREIRNEARANALAHMTSLDEWLMADLAGTLPPAVVGGSSRLAAGVRESLQRSAEARRRRELYGPRSCSACGEAFNPNSPRRTRCDRCVREGRPATFSHACCGACRKPFVSKRRITGVCDECAPGLRSTSHPRYQKGPRGTPPRD